MWQGFSLFKIDVKLVLIEKLLTMWYKVVKCGKIFDIFET